MSNQLILANNPNAYNDIPQTMNVSGKQAEAFTNKSVEQRREMVFVNPSSAISSNVLDGAVLDYRVENVIDRISACYLRVTYNNASGGNFVMCPPSGWLASIEIYANNGSTLLYQSSAANIEQWILDSCFRDRNEHNTTAAIRGTNSAYTTAQITIANGATGSYYVCIAPQFFRSLHLRAYSFDGNLLIRLRFQSASLNYITSGSWTTTEAVLLFSGYNESEHQQKYILSKATIPKCLSYYSFQRHNETQTLAASTKYQVRLSGIRGHVNFLAFGLRPIANASDPNLQFTFVRPDSFDILNASNQSITGFKPQTVNDMILMASHLLPNEFILNTNLSVWSFSQNPQQDIATGSNNGYEQFEGFHSLEWNTSSALTPGSYQILVYAICNEALIIQNAQLSSTRT